MVVEEVLEILIFLIVYMLYCNVLSTMQVGQEVQFVVYFYRLIKATTVTSRDLNFDVLFVI